MAANKVSSSIIRCVQFQTTWLIDPKIMPFPASCSQKMKEMDRLTRLHILFILPVKTDNGMCSTEYKSTNNNHCQVKMENSQLPPDIPCIPVPLGGA